MASVSRDEVKTHLRITQTTEDTLLDLYIEAADDYIAKFLNEPDFEVNGSIRAAALLIVGDLYQNREGTMDTDIKENPAVKNLLYPYRTGIGI